MKDVPVLPLSCSTEPSAEQPSPLDGSKRRSSNHKAVPASLPNLETPLFCFSINLLRHDFPHLLNFLSSLVLWVIPVMHFSQ